MNFCGRKHISWYMNFLPFLRDCGQRVLQKKLALCIFGAIFLCFAILGMCFIKTPAIYEYHLDLCDRFVDRVCFSERSVFVIFLERCAGQLLFVALALISGVHVIVLAVPSVIFVYRAYTFGGSIYIFFSVYRFSGALIVFALYLPIHLLLDVILLAAIVLSLERTRRFRCDRKSFCEILCDFAVLGVAVVAVCLLEMILLAALFHPIGYIL